MKPPLSRTEQQRLLARYRVSDGKRFRLKRYDPEDTAGLERDASDAQKAKLDATRELLAELQDKLFAQDRWALLAIFQAMDAAGKTARSST